MLSAFSYVALALIVISIVVIATRRFLASGTLILVNVIVHVLGYFSPRVVVGTFQGVTFTRSAVQDDLGLHPELLAQGDPLAFMQLFTHMFVHADFFHLLGNLIVLLAFALPFEERVGHRPFLLMYLLTGLVGAFAQLIPMWGQTTLMIGASGAVFGIIGAFAGSYPRLVIPLPLPLLFFMIFVRMKVIVAATVFALQQVIMQFLSAYNPGDNIAYFAHLGGLTAGLAIGMTYVRSRKKDVGQQVKSKLDLEQLPQFAHDEPTRSAYQHMRSSTDEPEVFEAWLERFFVSARCPRCESPVAPRQTEVVCTKGHRFDMRSAA